MVERALTLYVIRHGQTEHNVARRWTGRDDSHLTEKGRNDARANGRLLAILAGDLEHLDFVASPLHRACVTMELVREAAGLAPLAYRTDRRLMENDCGDWTGLSLEEIRDRHAEHFSKSTVDEWNWAAPSGQSLAQQSVEVGAFLSSLQRDSVLVCHGFTMRLIRAHLLRLTPSEAVTYQFADPGLLRLSQGTEEFFGT